jgi:hypothetical protein
MAQDAGLMLDKLYVSVCYSDSLNIKSLNQFSHLVDQSVDLVFRMCGKNGNP